MSQYSGISQKGIRVKSGKQQRKVRIHLTCLSNLVPQPDTEYKFALPLKSCVIIILVRFGSCCCHAHSQPYI